MPHKRPKSSLTSAAAISDFHINLDGTALIADVTACLLADQMAQVLGKGHILLSNTTCPSLDPSKEGVERGIGKAKRLRSGLNYTEACLLKERTKPLLAPKRKLLLGLGSSCRNVPRNDYWNARDSGAFRS